MATTQFRRAAFTGAGKHSLVSNACFRMIFRSGVALAFAIVLLQSAAELFGARRDFSGTALWIASVEHEKAADPFASAPLLLAIDGPGRSRRVRVLSASGERKAPLESGATDHSSTPSSNNSLALSFSGKGGEGRDGQACLPEGCSEVIDLASLAMTPAPGAPSKRELLKQHFGQVVDLEKPRYSKYDRYFRKYVRKYFGESVDWRWFKAQAFVESNLKKNSRSHAGAVGVMQILPRTFEQIKRTNRFFRGKSVYQPEWNIAAGIYYSRLLMKRIKPVAPPGERLQLMFACYNAGPTRILGLEGETPPRELSLSRVLPALPRETRNYLKRINVLMLKYREGPEHELTLSGTPEGHRAS